MHYQHQVFRPLTPELPQSPILSWYRFAMKRASVFASFRFGAVLLGVATACVASTPAISQNSAFAMPGNPNELMLLAARTNGLKSPALHPWHLLATYQIFNEDGGLRSEGTMEELWVSPTKNKLTYTSGALSQTTYNTEHGQYTLGGAGMDLLPAFRAHDEMLEPLPPPDAVKQSTFAVQQRDTGAIRSVCLRQQEVDGTTSGPTWCFEPDNPNLRLTVNANREDVLHSNPITFQGQTVAGDVKFSGGELQNIETDQPVFSAHIETLEPLTSIDDAAFIPPPEAKSPIILMGGVIGSAPPTSAMPRSMPTRVNISGGVAQGLLLEKVPPQFPLDAKQAGVSGTVVLQALIDKEGRISDLKVISGPPMLQDAAVDAVRQWLYRPYLLNGQPVEVNTTINIVFTLGK